MIIVFQKCVKKRCLYMTKIIFCPKKKTLAQFDLVFFQLATFTFFPPTMPMMKSSGMKPM